MKDNQKAIPLPHLESWMHERCEIPEIALEKRKKWWERQDFGQKVFDSLLSRIVVKGKIGTPRLRHVFFKLIQKVFKGYLKLVNQLKVFGRENVPKNGAIFYVNHPGAYDPLVLLAGLEFQTGAIVAWNYSWFMNMIDKYYGFITKIRNETREQIVEKMVRNILLKNRYFAIWPSGHPNESGIIEQGFSSIVRVYSVINTW